MNENTTRTLPADAGLLRGCKLSFSPNGDNAKTMKIKAVARTSEAIEIPSWASEDNPNSRLIHDLSGFRLRKPTVPMMVSHGSSVVGEWTRIEVQDGNLIAYGVLKSTDEGDIASILQNKLKADIPHSCSINFGDEMTVEEYREGESLFVNGRVYDGPATVIRLFYIREISICGLGADPMTETAIDKEPVEATEAQEPPVHTFSAVVRDRTTALSQQPEPEAETTEPEGVEVVNPVIEGEGTSNEATALTPERLVELSAEFGADLTLQYFGVEKLSLEAARAKYCQHLRQQLSEHQDVIKQLVAENAKQHQSATSVDFIPSDNQDAINEAKVNQFQSRGLNESLAKYAANIKVR